MADQAKLAYDAATPAGHAHQVHAALLQYAGSDQSRLTIELLSAMYAHYQSLLVDAPDSSLPALRAQARLVRALKGALCVRGPNDPFTLFPD